MTPAVAQRRSPITVSEATALISGALSAAPELEDILIEGELSNISASAAGHLYFTLKDSVAGLRCACFRTQARAIPFHPENGMTVIAHGHIGVYEAQGQYQLYVDRLEPSGVGALALAVEQCRRRLAGEGLLDERVKRPLPVFPRRVAVVTSRGAAAFRDVCTVIGRRAPAVDVVLSPATVQGEGAVETLITALGRAERVRGAGLILLVRGGGSFEDLMPFNDERLARAIRASRLPVLTGIGHETDLTIADQAADRRAPTPSAAAEMAVPSAATLRAEVAARAGRLGHSVQLLLALKRRASERLGERLARVSPLRRLPEQRQRLDAAGIRLGKAVVAQVNLGHRRLDVAVARLGPSLAARAAAERRQLDAFAHRLGQQSPVPRLAVQREVVSSRRDRLERSWGRALGERRARLSEHRARLEALSPERVIQRGYSITMDDSTGRVVSRVTDVRVGQRLRTRLADGSVRSDVADLLPG